MLFNSNHQQFSEYAVVIIDQPSSSSRVHCQQKLFASNRAQCTIRLNTSAVIYGISYYRVLHNSVNKRVCFVACDVTITWANNITGPTFPQHLHQASKKRLIVEHQYVYINMVHPENEGAQQFRQQYSSLICVHLLSSKFWSASNSSSHICNNTVLYRPYQMQ